MKSILILFTVVLLACSCQQKNRPEQIEDTKDMSQSARNISISISASPQKIYDFASNPENMPKWISFVKSVKQENGKWMAETDLGRIEVEFVPKNDFRILDHKVTLASGDTVSNPLRVIANGDKSEVVFTLFWADGRSEKDFNADAKAVEQDLRKLKGLMEIPPASDTSAANRRKQ